MRVILFSSALVLQACQMTPQQGEALGNLGAAIMSGGAPYGAYSQPYRPVGMFVRDQVYGFNRICYYNRVGSIEAVTIPASNICALQLP